MVPASSRWVPLLHSTLFSQLRLVANDLTRLMCSAQQHKRAMQRLTELNSARNAKGKRAPGRPTRNEASSECVIM